VEITEIRNLDDFRNLIRPVAQDDVDNAMIRDGRFIGLNKKLKGI